MLENLPTYITITFILSTLFTLFVFYWALKNADNKNQSNKANIIIIVLVAWLCLQGLLSMSGAYSTGTDFMPPKIFLFGILPTFIIYACLFFSKLGKEFMDSLPIEKLAYLHLVRIPVEFVLLWLFLNKAIPEIMTFEGWNFDIIMGLTAPLIIYFGFKKEKISPKIMIAWNMIGILFLIFIFTIAILSSPFPLQQLAFDQPNIGILHFPFSWLATFIVPVVVFGHMVSIRQLLDS